MNQAQKFAAKVGKLSLNSSKQMNQIKLFADAQLTTFTSDFAYFSTGSALPVHLQQTQ